MKNLVFMILITFGLVACKSVSNMYEQSKAQVAAASNNVVHKVNDMGERIGNYSNEKLEYITNEIKAWIYQIIKPALPWIFLISFLLLFGSLKIVIPFSSYAIIQSLLFIGSYGFIFSLFYSLGITSVALQATLWFLLPIIIIAVILFFSRKILLPKIKALNEKLNM